MSLIPTPNQRDDLASEDNSVNWWRALQPSGEADVQWENSSRNNDATLLYKFDSWSLEDFTQVG